MSVLRRGFLFFVTLATAAATPARGQAVPPAVAPANSASQSAPSIPDMSGTWVYLFCCGFQLPPSGPGPVTNRARRDGAADRNHYVGDYTNPVLKPQAAEVLKKRGEIELSGVPNPTPRNQCWPEGVPFVFSNFNMQVIQQPDRIIILYDHDHQVRYVRLNQPHPVQVTPSWYGDSVGHFDGDTLVIDTVGIKTDRPFAMVDWFGTPYTRALHVVERYRFIDDDAAKEAEERGAREIGPVQTGNGLLRDRDYKGRALQLQFTVEDEGVFTMPWSATITRRRSSDQWVEYVCAENTRGTYVVKDSAVPQADKPDF